MTRVPAATLDLGLVDELRLMIFPVVIREGTAAIVEHFSCFDLIGVCHPSGCQSACLGTSGEGGFPGRELLDPGGHVLVAFDVAAGGLPLPSAQSSRLIVSTTKSSRKTSTT